MTAHPTIVFIRHGQTDWNAENRLQGQRDIPLNDHGRGQARRNGEVLAETMPEAAGYDFVASPLARTRETMEIIRRAMGLEPAAYRLEPSLKELTFGDWEGFTYPEIEAREPGALAEREARKWDYVPPGGESYAMLSNRILPWLAKLERPTVIVSHGGVGRVALTHLLALDEAASVTLDFPQDQLFLWRENNGTWL